MTTLQRPLRPVRRHALSIIELLVAMAVMSVLMAVLLPAVQHAREAARCASCVNNLKQIGVAIHAFETATNRLPSSIRPGAASTVRVGVFTQLLPYLEGNTLWDQYNVSVNWSDATNTPVTGLAIETYLCPSGAASRRKDGNPDVIQSGGNAAWNPNLAGVTDYAATIGVDPRLELVFTSIKAGIGVLPKNKPGHWSDVRDGLSNTVMVLESAGRPFVYRRGPVLVSDDQTAHRINGGGWPRPASDLLFMGSNKAGTVLPPTSITDAVAINATNGDDVGGDDYPHPIYGTEGTSNPIAFHVSGANVLFADGSVKLIDEEVDFVLLAALITRDGAESTDGRSY